MCSGHIWKHYVMFRSGPLEKPLLNYCREESLRVLRVPFKKVVSRQGSKQEKTIGGRNTAT